ncbi:MAG TPA: mechanosensitive ion channel family protein [Gammaproteobacteria bacterium]|jgi:small-conductance mechanosensitive channel|nr:mechanosensitive ion channel family protein [Gammaproteobacteria bacterium]
MHLLEWLDYEILGNSVLAWVTSVTVFVLTWSLLAALRRVLRTRLARFAGADAPAMMQIAHRLSARTSAWLLLLAALLVGSRFLHSTAWTEMLIPRVVTIALLIQLGIWGTTALTAFIELRRERQLAADPGSVAALDLLSFVLRLAVWAAVLLVALDNLGVNITALVAGLGVGGIAVALAAQSILGDLFASLSIVLDKPFVVGDFLVIDELLGTVENVGLKTTRLRSLSGEQVVLANADLLKSRIRNYGRMFERRVVFSFGVTYQTPPATLKRIPAMVRAAIESQPHVRFDRSHFQTFGDSALVFETVYYVLSPDYNLYMDIQQAVNLALYEQFAAESIDFAYPTRTVFVAGASPVPA